jgi:hypothetical protein
MSSTTVLPLLAQKMKLTSRNRNVVQIMIHELPEGHNHAGEPRINIKKNELFVTDTIYFWVRPNVCDKASSKEKNVLSFWVKKKNGQIAQNVTILGLYFPKLQIQPGHSKKLPKMA